MSAQGAIMDAVLALIAAELPGVTTHRGLVLLDQIVADAYPFAMAYNPTEVSERLGVTRQEQRTLVTRYAIVQRLDSDATMEAAQEATLTVLEAVSDALLADPTLGGLVDASWLSLRATDEFPDTRRIVGVMEVTTERVA